MGFFDRFNHISSNILLTFGCYFDNPQCPGVGHLNGNSQLSSNAPPMPGLPPQRLNIDRCISISIITSISTRKTNMFVFLVLMLVLMRLCLCLCASENSIRQIGGFLLIFLLILLTLMSRVFSLVTLMLCLCARENHSQLYDCDDLDTSFLRPLRKII